jgi:glutathione synthase
MSGLAIGIQMDDLTALNFTADNTLLLAAAAEQRGHTIYLYQPQQLSWQPGLLSAPVRRLSGLSLPTARHMLNQPERMDLSSLDVILLRQEPPFDMRYITSTYLLELISDKVMVVNDPKAVRDAPEKILTQRFPDFIPPTLISRDTGEIDAFREAHRDIIFKPLYGYGSRGVARIRQDDENYYSLLETFLATTPEPLIIQKYLPEVRAGDRRIVLFDGEIVGIFARIPATGDIRATRRAGATLAPASLTARENEICAALKPYLQQQNLLFAGIDVIGGYLTEINVTSPAGVSQLNQVYGGNHEAGFWPLVEARLKLSKTA